MEIQLSDEARAWQAKACSFADEELAPWEVEAEMHGGELPAEVRQRHRTQAYALGFAAMDVPKSHGGLALSTVAQLAVWEQFGRITNALAWCFSEAQQWMFEACTEAQLERYILPLMRGTRHECYAITERESGSEVAISTSARRCPSERRAIC